MIDINIIRNNRNLVEENIKKKFQDEKLPLVGEILSIDERVRKLKIEGDNLRKERNTISGEIGLLMRDKKKEEAEDKKKLVIDINNKLVDIEKEEEEESASLREKMIARMLN